MRALRIFWLLLLLVCSRAGAETPPLEKFFAWVGPFSSAQRIQQLELPSRSAVLYRIVEGDTERVFALVTGVYRRPGQTLWFQGEPIAVNADGAFSVAIPVSQESNLAKLASRGEAGAESEILLVLVPRWAQIAKDLKQVPLSPSAVTLPPVVVYTPPRPRHYHIGAGINVGSDFYFPSAEIKYALSARWSLGVSGNYANSSDGSVNQEAVGLFLNLAYYFQRVAFQGVFAELGVGMYQIKLTGGSTETDLFPALSLMVGWRPIITSPFNVGVGLGAQYVYATTASTDSTYEGFFAVLRFDASFRF